MMGTGDYYGNSFEDWCMLQTSKAEIAEAHLLECACVLPEQSCPACREAARAIYGNEA